MNRFDPIDIFFIKIIAIYFITLICLIFTLIFVLIRNKIKGHKNEKLIKPIIEEQETVILPAFRFEDVNNKAILKRRKTPRLSLISLFKKLFNKDLLSKTTNIKLELENNSSEVKEVISSLTSVENKKPAKELVKIKEKPVVPEVIDVPVKENKLEEPTENKEVLKNKLDMPKIKSDSSKHKDQTNKNKPTKTAVKVKTEISNNVVKPKEQAPKLSPKTEDLTKKVEVKNTPSKKSNSKNISTNNKSSKVLETTKITSENNNLDVKSNVNTPTKKTTPKKNNTNKNNSPKKKNTNTKTRKKSKNRSKNSKRKSKK